MDGRAWVARQVRGLPAAQWPEPAEEISEPRSLDCGRVRRRTGTTRVDGLKERKRGRQLTGDKV